MNCRYFFISVFLIMYSLEPAHSHEHHNGQHENAPKPILGESVYNLKSKWLNQDNKEIKLSTFRGYPVVLAMIYTSCTNACPLIVSDMKQIERGLPTEILEQMRFVLISFDPTNDTPKKLKEYAKAHGLNLDKWSLISGSTNTVRELAAILDVRYKKIKDADFEHSNIVTILSPEGIIKYQQVGLNQDPKSSIEEIKRNHLQKE